MIRNLHWYDANSTRSYPLADTALAISTDGERLPSSILVDLNMRYPKEAGYWPFVSAVSVTATLVTVIIQCAIDPDDPSSCVPLAAFSARKQDLVENRNYPLSAMYPGVVGWIVFGDGIKDVATFSGKFSPRAGLLSPKAARPCRPLPVRSLATMNNATPLTGLVTLIGEPPVRISADTRSIDGEERLVAVISLEGDAAAGSANASAATVNYLEQMAGPCGKRAENRNCGDPEPLETINTVAPDCEGNITIELTGCATIAGILDDSGIVLDCALDLDDVCRQKRLPDEEGRLRTDYEDQCSESKPEPQGEPEPEPPAYSESETVLNAEMPWSQTFGSVPSNWNYLSGTFTLSSAAPPGRPGSWSSEGYSSMLCLVVYNGIITPAVGVRRTAEICLLTGVQTRAGMVFGYHPHPAYMEQSTWFSAELDYAAQRLQISLWRGKQRLSVIAWADVPGIALDTWYKLIVDTTPAGSQTHILVTLQTLSGATIATLELTTGAFTVEDECIGLSADMSRARFSFLGAETI